MYTSCPNCKQNGFCAEHPRMTCPECGLTYMDDSDWSGDAHSLWNCIRELQRRLSKYEKI